MPVAATPEEASFVLVTPPNPTLEEFKATIMNRRVEFNISKYVNEGWLFTKFNICSFFAVGLVLIAVIIGLDVAEFFAIGKSNWHHSRNGNDDFDEVYVEWTPRTIGVTVAFAVLRSMFLVPVVAGLYLAVFNAMRANAKVQFADFFGCFKCTHWLRLMGLWLTLTLMWAPTVVFWPWAICALYFQLTSFFAVPILVEQKDVSIFNAISFSFKIFHRYFCSMLGFLVLLGLMQLIGLLCFGIGLVVSVPVAFVATCYCYHHLIGVNGVAVLVPAAHLEGVPAVAVPVEMPSEMPIASAPSAV
jgi:hypothetical protein